MAPETAARPRLSEDGGTGRTPGASPRYYKNIRVYRTSPLDGAWLTPPRSRAGRKDERLVKSKQRAIKDTRLATFHRCLKAPLLNDYTVKRKKVDRRRQTPGPSRS